MHLIKLAAIMKVKDPSCIVIDEIVAFLALLIFLKPTIFHMVLSFILFRIFDILKPFPINVLEKKFDGFGIMIDDIVAATCYSVLIMLIFLTMFDQEKNNFSKNSKAMFKKIIKISYS